MRPPEWLGELLGALEPWQRWALAEFCRQRPSERLLRLARCVGLDV